MYNHYNKLVILNLISHKYFRRDLLSNKNNPKTDKARVYSLHSHSLL
jgi:hypothetical protein